VDLSIFLIFNRLKKNILMNRLIILTGPSCIGKSPLDKALRRFYPGIRENMQKLVLYNDRSPRPGEMEGVDYYFRKKEQIEAFRLDGDYIVMGVRGDLQALNLKELSGMLEKSHVFFEGNPYVAEILTTHPQLKDYPKLSVFLSPLSKEEIIYFKNPQRNVRLPDLITEIMRRKLLRRKTRQKVELSVIDLDDIETRASSAYREMKLAWQFDHVIPNHDGEDSDNWENFYYPIGDARKTMLAFVTLLQGGTPEGIETWEEGLLK
jgi:guanylate kinase